MRGFPRRSYYGKCHERPVRVNQGEVKRTTVVTPKKQINSFEAEYQKFIADLKAKKAAEEAKKLEENKEVIPETVTTVEKDATILNEEKVVEPTIKGLD